MRERLEWTGNLLSNPVRRGWPVRYLLLGFRCTDIRIDTKACGEFASRPFTLSYSHDGVRKTRTTMEILIDHLRSSLEPDVNVDGLPQ